MFVYPSSGDPFPLTARLAEHLGTGMELIHDHLLETYSYLNDNYSEIEDCWLYDRLPPSARLSLTNRLTTRFLSALDILALKAFSPIQLALGCRAEELLLWWTLKEARGHAELMDFWDEGLEEECEVLIENVFWDLDFQLMYEPRLDGIEKIAEIDIGSFSTEDWFLPFKEDLVVAPLTWPPDKKFWYKNWKGFEYPD